MPNVTYRYVLNLIEDYYRKITDNDPQIIDEAVNIASDMIYGTKDFPGICPENYYDEITEQDYYAYVESVRPHAEVSDYGREDEYTQALFYDVRDKLDDILQTELVDSHQNRISLWGECPKSIGSTYSIRDDSGEVTEIYEPRAVVSKIKKQS